MTQTVEFASETLKRGTLANDAVEEFYEARNRMFAGEVGPIAAIWAEDSDAVLMCPCGGRHIGYWDIRRGFEAGAARKTKGQIHPRDVVMSVGEELAYCACVEQGSITPETTGKELPISIRATTILKRTGEGWRVLYHHADPLPEVQAAVGEKPGEFAAAEAAENDPGVLKALGRFCGALRAMFTGNLEPIENIYLKTDEVTLATPAGNLQVGWAAVRKAFEAHSRIGLTGTLTYCDAIVRAYGDLAFASYVESAPDLTVGGKPYALNARATTIFRKEGREWYVVHHHSDLSAGLPELCGGLV